MTQRLRLVSGLALFSYVLTHLLNHSLGLFSLETADWGRTWFVGFWRHPVGTTLLYGSLLTHFSLVLWAIYQRRHLRLPRWEIVRIVLGISIPYFLLQHAAGTRLAHEIAGIEDNYTRQMLVYWILNPMAGARQLTLLVVAWIHGCIGIHYWLRVKPWHALTVPTLRILGTLVPAAAILGIVDMGQEVQRRAVDEAWIRETYTTPAPSEQAVIGDLLNLALTIYVGAIVLTFLAREARAVWLRRRGAVLIAYPDGRRVPVAPGTSILEASRTAGIPHASVCGGRGRCSTCRVRVLGRTERLPAPSRDEARVLQRVGAAPDIRLACQLRPLASIGVVPLLPPIGSLPTSPLHPDLGEGDEREIAILFADLRAYSRLAERRLPYDVVFVLNQYFSGMGEAVERSGGYLDKFIGDGVMALFGIRDGSEEGCRQAVRCAVLMAEAIERLNEVLHSELEEPLRIGIGIHVGPVIIGELGHGRARALTAIGDAANVASRLETMTKEHRSQLIVSEEVAARAGLDLAHFETAQVEVRGRNAPITVRIIGNALELKAATSG